MDKELLYLGEKFELGLAEAKEAEKIKELILKLDEEISILQDELETHEYIARKKIKEARIEKIKNINNIIEETKSIILTYENKIKTSLEDYCLNNMHTYVKVALGDGTLVNNYLKKCIVCGNSAGIFYNRESKTKEVLFTFNTFKQIIPIDCYKNNGYNQNCECLINRLEAYYQKLDCLNQLLSELCKLFGHDCIMLDSYPDTLKCQCCGKIMSARERDNDYNNSVYKQITKESNPDYQLLMNKLIILDRVPIILDNDNVMKYPSFLPDVTSEVKYNHNYLISSGNLNEDIEQQKQLIKQKVLRK